MVSERPSIAADHFSTGYSGKEVLHDINFNISTPSIYVVLGENGSGKTTTLRLNLVAFSRDIRRCLWHGIYIEFFTCNKHAEFVLIHPLFDLWFVGDFNRLRCFGYIREG